MKRDAIRPRHTYRGAGYTYRRVLEMGERCRPHPWQGSSPQPDEPGVRYAELLSPSESARNRGWKLAWVSTFARWAAEDVTTAAPGEIDGD